MISEKMLCNKYFYENNFINFQYCNNRHILLKFKKVNFDIGVYLNYRKIKEYVSDIGRIHLPLTDGPSVKCVWYKTIIFFIRM